MIARSETVRLGFESLRSNKRRTFLTALGLLIGNASVIWVVTISQFSQGYILDKIRGIGSNLISAGTPTKIEADYIKRADVDFVRQQLGSRAVAVSGAMPYPERMRVEGREQDVAIIGCDQYYPTVRNLTLLAGRFLDQSDITNRNHVALVTEKLANRLFGSAFQAIGRQVKIQQLTFDVVGSFKESTETFGQSELDENLVIPYTVLLYFARYERVDPLFVSSRYSEDVRPMTQDVKMILEARHRSGAIFQVSNLQAVLETADAVATALSLVLVVISAIALLISGVGIMNIMLVTVKERTREIGLRLAIGASRQDVLEQFLIEAILISLIGGVAGIVLGVAPALALRFFLPEFAIPISGISIVVAFTVSLLVGLVFGLMPARDAARLNPTEALRYE